MDNRSSTDKIISLSKDAFLLEISGLLTASVAPVIVRPIARAGVGSGPPRELVSLHDIHLRAVFPSDVVGIAIVVAVSVVRLSV